MTAGWSLVPWLGLAVVLGAATVAAMLAVAVPLALPAIERLAPARRARILTGLCVAPLAVGVALALACVLPSIYAALWPALDHCPRHADEHLHLCLVHPPALALGFAAWVVALGFVALLVVRAAPDAQRLLRARRVLARLRDASLDLDRGVRGVDSDAVFSFTGGLVHADIYISRGLRERIDESQLAAVIEHERAHARRHDVLRRQVAQLGALLHAPTIADMLLPALAQACEEACDAEAAATLGDRVRIAQAIVAVARLAPRPPPALATIVGFTAQSLTQRVTALLAEPQQEPARAWWAVPLLLVALVLLAPELHHTTETVLSLLAK